MRWLIAAAALWLAAGPSPVSAENREASALEEVVVTATRIPTDWAGLPFAASSVSREHMQRARQQLGLDESLGVIPGLFFQNRYNFAQDLRIAIRGFGARANFGIRGIRIFADDIPLTLPDGQSSVDAIDLGSAERIEVIRGPFSAVYGAASGGVISIYSEEGPDPPVISARINAGAYGYRQSQLKAGGQRGDLNGMANLTLTRLDGYRDHARVQNRLLNSKLHYDFSDETRLTLVFNALDSPWADDPGGLTAAEVLTDRRQAAPRNLLYDAGEALEQQALGVSYRQKIASDRELMLRGHYVQRQFESRQPFDVNSNGQGGSIDLDRRFGGLGGSFRWDHSFAARPNRLIVGLDYDAQRDHRKRYANNLGIRGELTTNQDEDVTTTGLYLQNVLELSNHVSLTLGGRMDEVEYRVSDRTGSGGSGERTFSEFSPMAGVSWSVDEAVHLYGNLSRSFDPPATTELANPGGPTGFNPELESQTATNYEIGAKGLLTERLRYELALFHIAVRDEIVPYELAGSGQSFFQNAGRSTHRGLESSLSVELAPGLVATASYTWSDFTFERFEGVDGERYDGNRIPGIPEHLFSLDLGWSHPDGFHAGLDLICAGRFYADNANRVASSAYLVANLRAAYRRNRGRWRFEPFIGLNNVFDERYSANIRLNAAFGRFYEPAPERHVYAGLTLAYSPR